MRLLAIDASTKSSGLALFENKQLALYKCITASGNDVIKRISKMIFQLDEFIKENQPIDKIVIEEVRPDNGLNIKTFKALMYLQAAINFLIHENYKDIEIEYIYPGTWRKDCGIKVGRGIKRDELKLADIKFVKNHYNINVNDDIADSICIAHSFIFNKDNKEDNSDAINWD